MKSRFYLDKNTGYRYQKVLIGESGIIDDSNPLPVKSSDPMLEIAKKGIQGTWHINKFGQASGISSNETVDVTDVGGLYVPPTAARLHQVVSSSNNDTGTVVISSQLTSASDKYTIIDTSAVFITDGVQVGDAYFNDTAFDHSIVSSVDSETQLTTVGLHDGQANNSGDNYRIVTPSSTGCAAIHIKNGLDGSFQFMGEFVVLNGTTPVNTVNSYLRINRAHNDLTGTSDTNEGDISLTALADSTVTAKILAGNGQTLMAHYSIPRGYKGYITHWSATIGKAGKTSEAQAECSLRYRKFSPVNTVGTIRESTIHLGIDGSSYIDRHYYPYKVVSSFTDVFVRVEEVTDNSTDVTAEMDIILVKD